MEVQVWCRNMTEPLEPHTGRRKLLGVITLDYHWLRKLLAIGSSEDADWADLCGGD